MDKRELDEILLDDDMGGSDRVRGHPSVVCVHPFVGRTVSPAQEGTGRNGPSFCHRCCTNAESASDLLFFSCNSFASAAHGNAQK